MNKIILHEPKGSNVICTKIKLGTNILGLKKWLLISDAINVNVRLFVVILGSWLYFCLIYVQLGIPVYLDVC